MHLIVENVHKSYPGEGQPVPALDGVDLSMPRGEFAAIVGPSGCGKSTLLHLIAGLDKPDQGRIEVKGKDIARLKDRALSLYRRNSVGLVFQFFNLFPSLSILDNVQLPGILGRGNRRSILTRAMRLLDQVGLRQHARRRANELSGGEMQRVALCRALLNRPALLLADEPTGNLDSENREQIHRLLKELSSQEGTTVLMVTHDSAVRSWVDRVISMKDGKVSP